MPRLEMITWTSHKICLITHKVYYSSRSLIFSSKGEGGERTGSTLLKHTHWKQRIAFIGTTKKKREKKKYRKRTSRLPATQVFKNQAQLSQFLQLSLQTSLPCQRGWTIRKLINFPRSSALQKLGGDTGEQKTKASVRSRKLLEKLVPLRPLTDLRSLHFTGSKVCLPSPLQDSHLRAGTLRHRERTDHQKNIVSNLLVTEEGKKNAVQPGTVSWWKVNPAFWNEFKHRAWQAKEKSFFTEHA